MHTILLIHGMGNFNSGWQAEAETALENAYKAFNLPESFGQFYEVKALSYDNVFTEYLEQLANHNDRLALVQNILQSTGNNLAKAVVEAAQKDPTNNFVYTHVADVLIYTVTEKQGQVISQVQEQLGQTLQKGQTWSVIAHSLGTRVVHDVLQSSYSAGTEFRQGFGKPLSVLMMANVSRLIQELSGGDVYQSELFPSSMVDQGGCYFYVNARHELDPFTLPKPFRPPLEWQTGRNSQANMYLDVKLPAEDTTQANVHSMLHYLSNPLTLRSFFSKTFSGPRLSDPLIDDTTFNAAYQAYKQKTTAQEIQDYVDKLELLAADPFGNWTQIVDLWTQFEKLVHEFVNP